jgi:hypothetical protein
LGKVRIPEIPAFRRLRQKGLEFKVSLGTRETLSQKIDNSNNNR